jgi:hypothetical protein
MHKKQKMEKEKNDTDTIPTGMEVIDVSKYEHKKVPTKKWRELIKKIWEVDPLICPECGAIMKMIALIDDCNVVEKILRHLELWEDPISRAPPEEEFQDVIFEPIYDDFQDCPEDYPGEIKYG